MSFLNGRLTEQVIVPVTCCEEQGTAFFIDKSQLITARHVVREHFCNPDAPEPIFVNVKGKLYTCRAEELGGVADIALLTITDNEPYEAPDFLNLLKDTFVKDLALKVYGYPQEVAMGANLVELSVMNRLEIKGLNDRSLVRHDTLKLANYDGLSGAPVVNKEGRAIGILTQQTNETLGYLSIEKISALLTTKGVSFAEDWQKEDNTTFGTGRSIEISKKAVDSIHDRYMSDLHQDNKRLDFLLKSITSKKDIDEKTIYAQSLKTFLKGLNKKDLKKIYDIYNHPDKWDFKQTETGIDNLDFFCQYALNDRFKNVLSSWDDEIEFNKRVIKLRDGSPFEYLRGGLVKNVCLVGKAGTGKTHSLCEFATKKQDFANIYLFFGTEFSANETATEHIRSVVCEEKSYEDFNNNMRKKNRYAVIVIDAINEGLGCSYWNNHLGALRTEIAKHDHIKLIISVRSPFEQELNDLAVIDARWKTIEVDGFEDKETAINNFFERYEIPQSYKEKNLEAFGNPLFLKIFCETFHSMSQKELSTLSKETIYKKYVEKKNVAVSQQVDEDVELNIADRYLKKLANYSVYTNHFNTISRNKAREYARRLCPGRLWSQDLLNAMLASSLLLNDRSDEGGAAVMFEYENFGDYYKAEQLMLSKMNVDETLGWIADKKRYFERHPEVSSSKFENAVVALFDCWTRQSAQLQRSEMIRRNEFLREEYIAYLMGSDMTFDEVMDKMTELDPTIERDLKMLRSPQEMSMQQALEIHEHLKSYETIGKRDLLWTHFVNGLFENYGSGIIGVFPIDVNPEISVDEQERVYLIRLGWLLTSSHPKYRALTMRMIRKQLNSHTDVILWLLKLFEKVNDPYVVAGLYCAVAGVVLTTRNEELAGSIAEYIYKTFYGQAETVPQDLIVRQWTMKIIERAYALDEHNDCWSKIQTPFAALPFDEDKITPYEDINRDYFGMQHGSRLMYNSIFGFEDFNRYIIGTNNRHRSSDYFKYDEIGGVYLGDDLTREEAEIAYYIKNVFGWNDKLGSLDNGKYSVDRSHNDEERIGKKFQWLAWFRLNARLMDSYKVTRSSYHYSDKAKEDELTPTPYPWNTSEVTYFDPTLDVEVYNSYNKLLSGVEALEVIGIQDESWIDNNKYVPTFRNQVIVEGSTPFVMLRGFDKATGGDKETVVITNAAFVKKSDSEAFAEWCRDKNFYGRWMPERNGMYEFLWNDYPWADAYYNAIELPAWERPSNGSPCDVMLAYEAQLQEHWEGIAYEDEYLTTVYMPCVEMMKEMGLYNSEVRGIVKLQTDDTIAAINSSKEDGVTGLFVRKDILDEFLRRKNYVLFYYVLGEKVLRAEAPHSIMKDLSAAYRYEQEGPVTVIQPMRVIERELPKAVKVDPTKIDELLNKNSVEGLTTMERMDLLETMNHMKEEDQGENKSE